MSELTQTTSFPSLPSPRRTMLGSIIERDSSASSSRNPATFVPPPPSQNGFPRALHRSAFKKSLASSSRAPARGDQPLRAPPVAPTLPPSLARDQSEESGASVGAGGRDEVAEVLRSVQSENEARVAGMSAEERESEREDLEARFGKGLLDGLRKRREARERKQVAANSSTSASAPAPASADVPEQDVSTQAEDETSRIIQSVQRENDDRLQAMSHDERMAEKQELLDKFGGGLLDVLRKRREAREGKGVLPLPASEADGEPDQDQARGESKAPAAGKSARRVQFASPPRSEAALPSTAGLFTFPFAPAPAQPSTSTEPSSEDTPESIRSRYFPTDTSYDPAKLEWMQEASTPSAITENATRYSLEGTPISSDLSATLPTHLGLHHHGDAPSQAGYTLAEVIHLCLSTSTAQRSAMLGVLAKIVRNDDGTEKGLRGKAIEVAGRAVDERGGGMMVVVRGIEVVYEVLVGNRTRRTRIEDWDLGMEVASDEKTQSDDDEEDILSSLHLPSLVPILLTHLAAPSFPAATTHALLSILLVFSLLPPAQSSLLLDPTNPSPILPTLARNIFATTPAPDPLNLQLLNSLIISSRATALEILNSPVSPLPALLKNIAVVLPTSQSRNLARLALDIYTSLGRYGLGASLCSDASDVFRSLGVTVAEGIASSSTEDGFVELVTAYYRLLTSWTTCAIDPHKTTPEHEITWSQIVGMGWGEDGVDALATLMSYVTGEAPKERSRRVLARTVMEFVQVWAEGARVNEPKGGEDFRALVGTQIVGSKQVAVSEMVGQLAARLEETVKQADSRRDWEAVGKLAGHLDGVLTLVAVTPDQVSLSTKLLSQLFDTALASSVWDTVSSSIYPLTRPRSHPRPSTPYAHLRPVTSLLSTLLTLSAPSLSAQTLFAHTLELLLVLLPGDEPLATTLITRLFTIDQPSLFTSLGLASLLKDVTHRHSLAILEPFFQFLVSPQEEYHIAPSHPTPASLPAVTTLRFPSTASLPLTPATESAHHRSPRGLPLRRTWCFQPISELLHSTSSQALAAAPPDWDASETELVQATLAFAAAVQKVSCAKSKGRASMGASEVILETMNVFFLEKGVGPVPEPSSGVVPQGEVFRDPAVNRLLTTLLRPFTASQATTTTTVAMSGRPATLEQAYALSHPSARTPFFQPYTDLHALYTSISYSHPLFTLLLLPPLASSYEAKDYRKLFWGEDNLPLMKGMGVSPADVLVEGSGDKAGLAGFLWPQEEDPDLLGAYLRAIVSGAVTRERNPFLYWVASHHLAMAIWSPASEGEERAGKLFCVLLARGSEAAVRDVIGYHQRAAEDQAAYGDEVWEWKGLNEVERESRLANVKEWAGEKGVERVRGLGVGK